MDCVFDTVDRPEMLWIATGSISTEVIHFVTLRDFALMCPIDEAVKHFDDAPALPKASPSLPKVTVLIEPMADRHEAAVIVLDKRKRTVLWFSVCHAT